VGGPGGEAERLHWRLPGRRHDVGFAVYEAQPVGPPQAHPHRPRLTTPPTTPPTERLRFGGEERRPEDPRIGREDSASAPLTSSQAGTPPHGRGGRAGRLAFERLHNRPARRVAGTARAAEEWQARFVTRWMHRGGQRGHRHRSTAPRRHPRLRGRQSNRPEACSVLRLLRSRSFDVPYWSSPPAHSSTRSAVLVSMRGRAQERRACFTGFAHDPGPGVSCPARGKTSRGANSPNGVGHPLFDRLAVIAPQMIGKRPMPSRERQLSSSAYPVARTVRSTELAHHAFDSA
jgi:hypothetical protein